MAGGSHRYVMPRDRGLHIAEREAAQLAAAGVGPIELPDLSFLDADLGRFALGAPYALLAPGSAPHRPAKRWPAERFAALAHELAARGVTPVLLGTKAEARELAEIARTCPRRATSAARPGWRRSRRWREARALRSATTPAPCI